MMPAESHSSTSQGSMLVAPTLSDEDFGRMARFIADELGIEMALAKKPMIAARLLRRVRELGYPNYGSYFDYLHSPTGRALEGPIFVDLVTTHTTHFFREQAHFDAIAQFVLPQLLSQRSGAGPLRVWSAACSTGEEPYSLAMLLESQRGTYHGFDFSVLGTDVSERALSVARRAVYPITSADQVPSDLRNAYLLRSRDPKAALLRISPALRAKVRFAALNFMAEDWSLPNKMDLIVCRNVLIYFSRSRQAQIIEKLSHQLTDDGFLILSQTESLVGHHPALRTVGRSIFQHCPRGAHLALSHPATSRRALHSVRTSTKRGDP